MKVNELCKQYHVSKDLQKQFMDEGILEEHWQEVDVETEKIVSKRLETSVCLTSLGLDVKTVKSYILLEESKNDTRKDRVKILRRYREKNLKHIHNTKKTMDCIDCVLDELQKKR